MSKIKNWSPLKDGRSRHKWVHDRTRIVTRVLRSAEGAGEFDYGLPDEHDAEPDESAEGESYAKWVTAVFADEDADSPVEVLSTTSTKSDARSAAFSFTRGNTNGDHEEVETNALIEPEDDDMGDVDPVERAKEMQAKWHGSRQCLLCSSTGQFAVVSRPEVVAMYGPEEVSGVFSHESEATHACLECGFLWFGVAESVNMSSESIWRVRVSADGKRIERVPGPEDSDESEVTADAVPEADS